MSGTQAGAMKGRDVNLSKDPDYYAKIGSAGGRNKTKPGGFALLSPEQQRVVSSKGGRARWSKPKTQQVGKEEYER